MSVIGPVQYALHYPHIMQPGCQSSQVLPRQTQLYSGAAKTWIL